MLKHIELIRLKTDQMVFIHDTTSTFQTVTVIYHSLRLQLFSGCLKGVHAMQNALTQRCGCLEFGPGQLLYWIVYRGNWNWRRRHRVLS